MENSKSSLEIRFKEFLDNLPDSENLDELLTDAPSEGKRADYLLDERNIVLELKSLESDPEYKIDEFIDPLRTRSDFPVFYWDADLTELLAPLQDSEVLQKKIFNAVTRSVQTALEKANAQIRSTKANLDLPSANGLVVILNENIEILNPRLVTGKVNQILLKRRRDGSIRYDQIGRVVIVSEGHIFSSEGGQEFLPVVQVLGPSAQDDGRFSEYIGDLQSKWCDYLGVPLVSRGEVADLSLFEFKPRKKELSEPPSTEPLSNEERCRRAYRRNPYLRTLSEEDFLDFATKVITTMAPQFIKGGKKLPFQSFVPIGIKWIHVLEEAEYRRLDMRKLQIRLPDRNTYITETT